METPRADFLAILNALSAHEKGVVHRNLKPLISRLPPKAISRYWTLDTAFDFTRNEPRILFDLPSSSTVWNLLPDGERFLVLRNIAIRGIDEQNARINVVGNWFNELKERVPVP